MKTNEPDMKRFAGNELLWRASSTLAAVCAIFALVVSILLIANYLQIRAISPLDNPELLKLRQQLAVTPQPDPALIQEIRALDLLARKAFFTSQAHLRLGGYLLLGSVALMLLSLRLASASNTRPPAPEAPPASTHYWRMRARSKELIVFFAALWIVAALFAAFLTKLEAPIPATASVAVETVPTAETSASAVPVVATETPAASQTPQPAASYPDWETQQKNWPAFRGPGGYGVAHYTTAPTEWDAESKKNILWKTEVPIAGSNSPVVWDKRVFLSGATADDREVFCFDADSGKLLWQRKLEKLPGTPEKVPELGEDTGYAASSMTVQGDRVFAIFANGDLGCYDAEGNLKWTKSLGLPDNHYGHSSSLLAFKNLLFVQFDQKTNGKLFAFDIADGHEVWNAPRTKISWASPICVETPFGFQLVLNSTQNVDAYDPLTGTPVWQLKCLDGEVAPSPAYNAGRFFVANEYATSTAITFAPDTKPPSPAIAWQWDESLPDVASPLCATAHFYLATSRGELVCLDAATGKKAWSQEYQDGFYASPILVGDRVYAFDRVGVAYVVKTGPTYELIATNKLGEPIGATPAFLDGRIYVRTEKNLICIAK